MVLFRSGQFPVLLEFLLELLWVLLVLKFNSPLSKAFYSANVVKLFKTMDHNFFEPQLPRLKAIIYAEFDNEIGRVIKYQVSFFYIFFFFIINFRFQMKFLINKVLIPFLRP